MSTIEDLLPYAGAAIVLAPAIYFGVRTIRRQKKERAEEKMIEDIQTRRTNYIQNWIAQELPIFAIDLANANISPEEFFGRRELIPGSGMRDKYFRGEDPETNRETIMAYLQSRPLERIRLFNQLEKRVELLNGQSRTEVT